MPVMKYVNIPSENQVRCLCRHFASGISNDFLDTHSPKAVLSVTGQDGASSQATLTALDRARDSDGPDIR